MSSAPHTVPSHVLHHVGRDDHGAGYDVVVAGGYDVVVAGGGPAGAATALRLARAGYSVALLERTTFDRPRVGETLAPSIQPLLRDLGVWQEFVAAGHLPSWGTRSLWAEPASHSHLMSGYDSGWHVDRRTFDQMLFDAAAIAGASAFPGTSLTSCLYTSGIWHLTCATGLRLTARVLIDATGRQATIARSLGARRILFDHLVGITARYPDKDTTNEQYLLIEPTPLGWWYTAPLPQNQLIAMLITDTDLCRHHHLSTLAAYHSHQSQAPTTATRLATNSTTKPHHHPPTADTNLPATHSPDRDTPSRPHPPLNPDTPNQPRPPLNPDTPSQPHPPPNPDLSSRPHPPPNLDPSSQPHPPLNLDTPSRPHPPLSLGAPSRLRVYSAASHRVIRPDDPRPWLAVGDAALAVDPISGSGVPRALRTAESAARTAAALLTHPDQAAALIEAYESTRNTECTTYLTTRAAYYAAATPHPTPFWTRRRSPQNSSLAGS
ncbi:FAD-dependent oxidoreductase [Kribbella sp. NPDC004536]|uniref:NAD(P)/FAD-dependent oxidoreductase n=1 Tax=Kribbella sp. NPDC004536 TaxID=3364106 RepID=UPI0036A979EC